MANRIKQINCICLEWQILYSSLKYENQRKTEIESPLGTGEQNIRSNWLFIIMSY